VLTGPVVLPGGTLDGTVADPLGPARPEAPEPVTDGCGDRLVVVTRPAVAGHPSAVLLAAQQLSADADLHPYRWRRPGTPAADRRQRRQRDLLAERRADRDGVRPPTG
jgi:hypothetical protein